MRKSPAALLSGNSVCAFCAARAQFASVTGLLPVTRQGSLTLQNSSFHVSSKSRAGGWGSDTPVVQKGEREQKGESETPKKGAKHFRFQGPRPIIRKQAKTYGADLPKEAMHRYVGKKDVANNNGREILWRNVTIRKNSSNLQPDSDRNDRHNDSRMSNGGRPVTWGEAGNSEWSFKTSSNVQEATPDQPKRNSRRFSRFALPDEQGNSSPEFDTKRGKTRIRERGTRLRGQEDEEIDDRALNRMEKREQRKAEKKARRAESSPTPIILPDFISIGNLASVLRVRVEDFTEKLQELGFEDFTNDHVIGAEDAGLIAQEFNFEPTTAPQSTTIEDITALPEPSAEDKELMLNRPPVITIMGHVDHGKTTLLDYLRKSSVAAGEHGGITQHIGAFTVNMPSGRTITFLDTPGHAAFLDMRARGANVTDIVILVVAADDSVKPQTLEAIKHANAAGSPMIVAITKADKEQADVDRVKRDLAQHGVEVEDFGGDVQAIPVSGKTGQGMEDLEDAAIALADILDVRADTTGQVEGWVLESSLKRAGKVATVLVRRGTMKAGNIVVAGQTWAKIRTLRNEAGQVIAEASPGQPVEVDGWDESPDAGAEVLEAPSVQRAREVAELRSDLAEEKKTAADVVASNEQRTEHRQQRALAKQQEDLEALKNTDPDRAAELQAALDLADSNKKSRFIQVPLVIRADVAGSVEALSAAILAIGNSEIRSTVLRAEVGQITESDIELAATAEGVIVNFGLPIDNALRRRAEEENIKVIDGNVIYRVTDEVKELLENRLPPLRTEKVLGEAEVAQIFMYSIKGKGKTPVAGCKVRNGAIERSKFFKVFRAGQVVHDGVLSALKSYKKDTTEVRKGNECGMSFLNFGDFQEGDHVQCYDVIEEKRYL